MMQPKNSLRAHPLPTPSPEVDPEEPPLPPAPPQEQEDQAAKASDPLKRGHERLRVRVIVERPPPPPPQPLVEASAASTTCEDEQEHQAAPYIAEIRSQSTPTDYDHDTTNNNTHNDPPTAPSMPPRRRRHPAVLVAGRSSPIPPPQPTSFAPSPPRPHPSPKIALLLAYALSATLVYPLGVAFVTIYCTLAFLLASLAVACVWPSLLLASSLYEALPFARAAFSSPRGPVRQFFSSASSSSSSWRNLLPALLARLAFEASHATAALTRLLTLPLRPALPSLFVAGMAKCGTTTLAAYLKREGDGKEGRPRLVFPAGAFTALDRSGGDGGGGGGGGGAGEKSSTSNNGTKLLSLAALAEAASKETHFLTGALGRRCGWGLYGGPFGRDLLYRSFYPLFAGAEWWRFAFWRRAVDGALGLRRCAEWGLPPVVLVDATPTYAALPFCARRMIDVGAGAGGGGGGGARVVVVVRDPVDALCSAEGMLRDLGALPERGWGLREPLKEGESGGADPRFADLDSAAKLWQWLERLPPGVPVPRGIARRMCGLGEGDGSEAAGGLGGPVAAAKAGELVRVLADAFDEDEAWTSGGGGEEGGERCCCNPRLMVASFADLVERPESVVKSVLEFASGERVAAAPTPALPSSKKAFVPLAPRMTGGGGAAGGGGGGVVQIVVAAGSGHTGAAAAAPPPPPAKAPAVHPTVRARLEREFEASSQLLTQLTGVDASVLLRRPVTRGAA